MEETGVLMVCPMSTELEEELDKKFNLFRFWNVPNKREFLEENSNSIRAIVGSETAGADTKLIDSLPKLEIISSFSIRVTNTPNVLTEDVADLPIGLIILATSRRICESDHFVRNGLWKSGDFKMTTKVFEGALDSMPTLQRLYHSTTMTPLYKILFYLRAYHLRLASPGSDKKNTLFSSSNLCSNTSGF
ncbi:hypothetical protein MKX03_003339 [Papaver bracteatum]|nr:hypothetical protein MKX03_003339 [Papaver bracteatum]